MCNVFCCFKNKELSANPAQVFTRRILYKILAKFCKYFKKVEKRKEII